MTTRMQHRHPRSRAALAAAAVLAAVALLAAPALPAAASSTYRVQSASVVVHCPMTVGGSFQARTAALTGELSRDPARPEEVAGELIADLTTVDTGIGLRNEHMRDKYLEVDRGPEFASARLGELTLAGAPAEPGGVYEFKGVFLLHGERRPVAGKVEVHREAGGFRVRGSFPVNVIEHGIAKPRWMGVGIKDEIRIEVDVLLAPVDAGPSGAPVQGSLLAPAGSGTAR